MQSLVKIELIGFQQSTLIEPGYDTATSDLRIFENFENWENTNKKFYWKFPKKIFGFFKNRNIYERTLFNEYMYAQNFELLAWKMAEFCRFECPKRLLFYAIFEDLGVFPIFKFCPIWAVQKVFYDHFLFLTKIWPKNVYRYTYITQTQSLKFDIFALVTLDDSWFDTRSQNGYVFT